MNANRSSVFLFAEPAVSGHRLSYVRLLATEALRRGHSVHIALPEGGTTSPEFGTHIADLARDVTLQTLKRFSLAELAALTDRTGACRTVVTDGDALALELARTGRWSGRGKLSLLIMRENAQTDSLRVRMWAKNLAKKLVIRRAASTRNVSLAVLKSATWAGASRYPVAVDPVELICDQSDVDRLRHEWGLEDSTCWFGVLGAITARKNVPLLMESLADTAGKSAGLLVAGRIDPLLRPEIDAAASRLADVGKRVVIVDRILSDVELDAAVSSVNCLLLAHSNEGPSGLLGKAACCGTRVIASGARSLRADIEGLPSLGQWTELDRDAIRAAMQETLPIEAGKSVLQTNVDSFVRVMLADD
ncbi:hypothetical protein [Paenarthrobacter sp. JL.01a]|uniref:hypothetical protein n=1 Tax=Paenarthrobacter sp. JL.01a TaxID=2979324 RepID=UPI0021CAC83F|nr:hypothetical protein [Paenarthrobacter sp. JL.01a]UXM90754.1 hypothetical protein N5P29_15855 [Paenarthrobacter sp. JL.01a]